MGGLPGRRHQGRRPAPRRVPDAPLAAARRGRRSRAAQAAGDRLRQLHPDRRRARVRRRPGDGVEDHRVEPLERRRDGHPGRQARGRRPHRDLRLGGLALRDRLQPLLPRQGGGRLRRPALHPGPRLPGIYARAFLDGRLTEQHLDNFRQEAGGEGLPSYPHPRRLPWLWEFPTVSMGLGPLSAIYQARFNRYLANRSIKDTSNSHVWAFLGDGEMDEPESTAALALAAREQLDNLTFVINCNLQRLDGPVRANFRVVQELEAQFRGAGWNVVKTLWGNAWDELFRLDTQGRCCAGCARSRTRSSRRTPPATSPTSASTSSVPSPPSSSWASCSATPRSRSVSTPRAAATRPARSTRRTRRRSSTRARRP